MMMTLVARGNKHFGVVFFEKGTSFVLITREIEIDGLLDGMLDGLFDWWIDRLIGWLIDGINQTLYSSMYTYIYIDI